MANMEQIYALQEVIRKKTKALEKDKYGFKEDFNMKYGKSVNKEDAARGVDATVSGLNGINMEFIKNKKGGLEYHGCKISGVLDFESFSLKPADAEMMYQLFVVGGQVTPAEFRKTCEGQNRWNATLTKLLQEVGPAFDLVVSEICKKNNIGLDKAKEFAQGKAAIAQKLQEKTAKQMAAQAENTL